MNKRIWLFQDKKDLAKRGSDRASWYVGWYDLQGKRHSESCGSGSRGKSLAEKRLRRIQSEIDIGVHIVPSKKLWTDFRNEYDAHVLSRMEPSSRTCVASALNAFERHAKPLRVEGITTQVIDLFAASRQKDNGKKVGSRLSPATLNKDLRHLKAALKFAVDWGYLSTIPKIRMAREPEKLPRFVTPENFEIIYSKACPAALIPVSAGGGHSPCDWWKALVVTAYMTGLRIMEIIAMKWDDIDLTKGFFITRAKDNKAKRDEIVPLHAVVIEHLMIIKSVQISPFYWPHDPRTLWVEFGRIQRLAGIHVPCSDEHKHTPSCHVYGFHDFRRAFATVNAPRLKPETLQKLMRHRSYKTTLGYINMTSQIEAAVETMPVPEFLRKEGVIDNSTDACQE